MEAEVVLTEQQIAAEAKQCEQLGLFPFIEGVVKVGKENWKDKKIFTPQQKLFVYYFLGGKKETLFNGFRSALAAGYSKQTANQSWQIKQLSQVDKAIKDGLAQMGLGKQEVKALFADRARVTMADLPFEIFTRKLEVNGKNEIIEDAVFNLAEAIRTGAIRYVKRFSYSKNGRIGVELIDAADAQDKIAKIHNLYTDEAGDGNGKNNTTPLSAMAGLVNDNVLKAAEIKKLKSKKKKK